VGLTFLLCLLCLIRDINKLNFSAYIGVGAVIYTLLVVMIQCNSYYNHYKKNVYVEEDESTHENWTNFKDAWKSDLDFFKGMANLFTAYACHPGIFPVYAGFKRNYSLDEGVKKMKLSTLFATILTTALHIVSIVCSYLTDPYSPEDLVIYRKNKGSGKDVFMVISRLFISLSLFFTLPGYYFPLRLSIANVFTHGTISRKFNLIFTFVSCYVCAAIASVYDKILSYLSYIGFISVFICYLIPVLLYLKTKNEKITKWNNLLELLAVCVLIIIGVAGGIVTIIGDVKK
jgi:amino acid permease